MVGRGVDPAVPPEELRQAHERLRLEPEEERATVKTLTRMGIDLQRSRSSSSYNALIVYL